MKYVRKEKGAPMSLLQAILMGVIQGLTEFLPVSSSGHLALFQILFHVNTDTGLLFSVLLHLGTLISIFVAFHKDVGRLIREGILLFIDIILNIVTFFENLFLRKDLPYRRVICTAYRKFVMLILVSTIPTGIIGIVDSDLVEMSETILLIPGACLIITGILLLIADRLPDGHKTPKHVTYTNAFMVGICQGLATLPGLSRSGTTITACLASGFDRKFAVKYSFLMSIPAVLGAAILEIKDCFGAQGSELALSGGMIANYIVGMIVAAVIGYISIKTMLVIVRRKKFTGFAIYCILVGIVSVVGYFIA